MLKQRVITALILVAILFASLVATNPIYWRLLISLVVAIGFWEWLRFCKVVDLYKQLVCFVIFALVVGTVQAGIVSMNLLASLSCLVWLILLLFTLKNLFAAIQTSWLKIVIGIWILSTAGYFMIELKTTEYGVLWILCFLVAIWAADIGAYFAGRRFGKTKLAPSISPGKTVEGLIGGLLLVVLVYMPVLLFNFSMDEAFLLLVTVLVTALISVGGDLFESKLKRFVDLKDSSQILPGHGGVLDRIDSLLAGLPFFILGLILLGYLN
ncbi:MAG: phosphatidate cytidylyltransferase [Acidiferrobacterales bacterium]|nr:phosphatidate cytidylyltransferase [Acidiferrobacterales bacterium]